MPHVQENEQYHYFVDFQIDFQHQSKHQQYRLEFHNLPKQHVNHFYLQLHEFQEHLKVFVQMLLKDLLVMMLLHYEAKSNVNINYRRDHLSNLLMIEQHNDWLHEKDYEVT